MKEEVNYNIEKISTKNGPVAILFIDPKKSEDIYEYKDDILRFGAEWNDLKNRFQWRLPSNPEDREKMLNNSIYPCIKFLRGIEDFGKSKRTDNEMIEKANTLIKQIDGVINGAFETTEQFDNTDVEDVKKRLLAFKQDLLKCTEDADFRKKFEPILMKVATGGYQYSILNSILIHIQDPKATIVYCRSKWGHLNRYVTKEGLSHPIALWVPKEGNGSADKITKSFLKKVGKDDINQLTPQELDELDALIGIGKGTYFRLVPEFYDVRFTKVGAFKVDKLKTGKSKLVNTKTGNENGDLKWFDKDTPATEESEKLYDACVETIKQMGIKVNYVDKIGNSEARGVSMSGSIDILKNVPKNIGTCNTLIHELAHELFHQTYLKNTKEWGKYFIGKQDNANIREQQAELCAWCVMRLFGYDMQTNINYLGNWGINEENALQVFDQIANGANTIFININNNMNKNVNEGLGSGLLTGEKVAEMLGGKYKKLYDKSKIINQNELNEQKEKAEDYFKRICNVNIK